MTNKQQLSKCHEAWVRVEGGVGDFSDHDRAVTMHYVCTKCGKPCDLLTPVNDLASTNPADSTDVTNPPTPDTKALREDETYEQIENCFDDLVVSNSGAYIRVTFGDKSVNVYGDDFLKFRHRLEALITSKVISELENIPDYKERAGIVEYLKDRINTLKEQEG